MANKQDAWDDLRRDVDCHHPRWGQPIWEGWQRNEFNINRFTLSAQEYDEIIQRICTCLAASPK